MSQDSSVPNGTEAPDTLQAMRDLNEIARRNVILLRKKSGWTLTELGERCGIAHATISRFEANQRGASLQMLGKLARGLGVSPEQLLQPISDEGAAAALREAAPQLTGDEHHLLASYRAISADEQRRVRAFAEGLAGTAFQIEQLRPVPPPLPADEQELLDWYRRVPAEQRGRVRVMVEGVARAAG